MRSTTIRRIFCAALATLLVLALSAGSETPAKKKQKEKRAPAEDPYADYVWPPPPDEPRVKLVEVLSGRADVEAPSKLQKALLGASPQSVYDKLKKPFAVAFDPEGRILVTDSGNAALVRFDRAGGRLDVLGTTGATRLGLPLGLHVTPQGTIFVADAKTKRVVAFDAEGKVVGVYGRQGDLENPTDAQISADGKRLLVADSKAHRIVLFDLASGERTGAIGEPGDGDGQFAFPTSLALDAEANLYVVDQINARVQVFDPDGEYLDQFGSLGVGFANFVRPKDIAIDERGFLYVTDNAFNNVQLFDADFALLTFVGAAGMGPGGFNGASGVAVRGDEFAVVDQLGRRVQVFRLLGGLAR